MTHQPGLPGNPHYENAKTLSPEDGGGIEATLALAHEQRTANLLHLHAQSTSMAHTHHPDGPINRKEYEALRKEIKDRLLP
jgi:hypothetical protein